MSTLAMSEAMVRSLSGEGRDAGLAREARERLRQRRRHGHARARALLVLGAALLAREPDALDPGKPARGAQLGRDAVDVALERGDVAEGGERERDDGVSRVGDRGVVGVE